MIKNFNNKKGQSLIELVVGIGFIAVIAGAMAVITARSLQNTQFSKNQTKATKLAQENLEKVRTIKNSNFGFCTQSDASPNGSSNPCSSWDDSWTMTFGTQAANCVSNGTCTFILRNACNVRTGISTDSKPFCLTYSATRADLGTGLTGQIFIEDEVASSQKRVTSVVYWSDSTGEHSSYLQTILTRLQQ